MQKISAADYLIEFFIANGVTDIFGYQGGMVCHIFDSLDKYKHKINYYSFANEQGAALAACGYAQSTGKLGVVITTSGPGFTNALTGLANAYYDSIPLMLISGQVNTKDKRRNYTFRQYGFQEIQAVEIAKPIAKKVYEIDFDTDIIATLNDAYKIAFTERKGSVFIDFPINMQREILECENEFYLVKIKSPENFDAANYINELMNSKQPVIIAGAAVNQCNARNEFKELIENLKIPVITTLPAVDLIPSNSPYHVGFLGGTARREAGIILKNTDFVLSLGTRLCNKAIGYNHDDFIPNAKKFIRVDIDKTEFERQLKTCEEDITADLKSFITNALEYAKKISGTHDHSDWLNKIHGVKKILADYDLTLGNELLKSFSEILPEKSSITLDVGNNLVYGAQSCIIKNNTRVFMSTGLGAMGYSIPAAIGVAIGSKNLTYAVSGDGGAQMNIQELNTIAKLNLPVKILILNNHALAHIILFQDRYLNSRRTASIESNDDYFSCDFTKIAQAYGIRAHKINSINALKNFENELKDDTPLLLEFELDDLRMLPNIHGGLDPLTNGPELPSEIINQIKNLMA